MEEVLCYQDLSFYFIIKRKFNHQTDFIDDGKIAFHDFKAGKFFKMEIFRLWFDKNKCLLNVFLKPSVAFKYNQSSNE